MSREVVNTTPGTADTVKTGFAKLNTMMAEIYATFGDGNNLSAPVVLVISSDAPRPLGAPSAGATGQAADAGHVHPLPTPDVIGALDMGAARAAGMVLAGPASGADSPSTFRALVASDLPGIDVAKLISGILGVARGGTGTDTAQSGYFFAGPATGAALPPAWRRIDRADLPAMLGAGALAAGEKGAVPTPPASAVALFLRHDGSWVPTPSTMGGTVTSVNVQAPAAGITVSGGPVTVSGTIVLEFTNDLAALEALTGTGWARRTGDDTWALATPTAADVGAAPSVHGHAIADVTGLQVALDSKAPLASPALTGTPTAPTAVAGTNTTQLATTAFVRAEVAALVDAAPSALDTLNELAAALADDPNFAASVTTSLAGKADIGHGHNIADVTGLQGALDGKAVAVHGHAVADVTGLQAALDGKQPLTATLSTLAARAVGAASGTDILDRDAADGRYAPIATQTAAQLAYFRAGVI